MEESLQQHQRARITLWFLSGEWGVELEALEADLRRASERDQAMAR